MDRDQMTQVRAQPIEATISMEGEMPNRLLLVLLMAGCGPATKAQVQAQLDMGAADMRAPGDVDMADGADLAVEIDMSEVDMASALDVALPPDMACMPAGGYCDNAEHVCCEGLCGADSVCHACGTAGLPCCPGSLIGIAQDFCSTDRAGQRFICDPIGGGVCNPCGKAGQECCLTNKCTSPDDACTACNSSQSGGPLTRCQPLNCGSRGNACCVTWAQPCGSGPVYGFCFNGQGACQPQGATNAGTCQ